MFSKEEGDLLIKIARDAIVSRFDETDVIVDESIKQKFSKIQGVFVTLKMNGELRGCIGFTNSPYQLWDSVAKAARAAAFEDPRFDALSKDEYEKIKIEISVLSVPELIKVDSAKEYLEMIKIGRDGLIIKAETGAGGLLLPQVPVEFKWDVKMFLEHTCRKAMLPVHAWKDLDNKLYSFQAQIFSE